MWLQVRVRVVAAGVSLPDVMMREGIHPETPRVPFTPGWDLVGEVDLIALFDLLQQHEIKPLIAQRLPLAEARRAHELLGAGGVTGKIVLVGDG